MLEQPLFFPTRTARTIALLVIFALGIAIRLYDLTDLPLEFHSTRQLLSALKARGMYYETRTDVSTEERAGVLRTCGRMDLPIHRRAGLGRAHLLLPVLGDRCDLFVPACAPTHIHRWGACCNRRGSLSALWHHRQPQLPTRSTDDDYHCNVNVVGLLVYKFINF